MSGIPSHHEYAWCENNIHKALQLHNKKLYYASCCPCKFTVWCQETMKSLLLLPCCILRVEVRGGGNATFLWELSSVCMYCSIPTVRFVKAYFSDGFAFCTDMQYSTAWLKAVESRLSFLFLLSHLIQWRSFMTSEAQQERASWLSEFQTSYAKQDSTYFCTTACSWT